MSLQSDLPPSHVHGLTPSTDQRWLVYYAASEYGGIVKIGTTVDLPRRLLRLSRRQGVPLHALATEPGGYRLEEARHRQFAHVNAFGEWFWQTPELVSHIRALQTTAA